MYLHATPGGFVQGDHHSQELTKAKSAIGLGTDKLAVQFFEEKLGPQCMKWLEDSVFCIREAATRNLMKLAQEFGPDWARVNLVPPVRLMGLWHTIPWSIDTGPAPRPQVLLKCWLLETCDLLKP